ncbi:hypothetical protein PVK06_036438 [Gossypium arboreum]|uniref:Uncharacterized protein n=1 Tax=Gossypium arboreum TaxID=29729 RepID=A0ABR0NJJ9_GOSAR|nr:hypothetical protein PVK06_036438 [Gossypium arboreum]
MVLLPYHGTCSTVVSLGSGIASSGPFGLLFLLHPSNGHNALCGVQERRDIGNGGWSCFSAGLVAKWVVPPEILGILFGQRFALGSKVSSWLIILESLRRREAWRIGLSGSKDRRLNMRLFHLIIFRTPVTISYKVDNLVGGSLIIITEPEVTNIVIGIRLLSTDGHEIDCGLSLIIWMYQIASPRLATLLSAAHFARSADREGVDTLVAH